MRIIFVFIIILKLIANGYPFKNISEFQLTKIGHDKQLQIFIQKKIKQGVSKSIDKKLLSKILIGRWNYANDYSVVFQKNGVFYTHEWRKRENDIKFQYSGKWKVVKDNIINFKVKGSKKWQECIISQIYFRKRERYNYYYLELLFNDVYFKTAKRHEPFLGGGIEVYFYYKKEKKESRDYYKGLK